MTGRSTRRTWRAGAPRGFTLIEMLVVIVILGIAGAMVIPSMGQAGVLRVQASLRTVVSDMVFAQADAIAFQRRRALVFDVPKNSYRILDIQGGDVSTSPTLYNPGGPGGLYVVDLQDEKFGGARITAADFNGGSTLFFDDMGAPVLAASGDAPGAGGSLTISGSEETYTIVVEPYSGRVTVRRIGSGN